MPGSPTAPGRPGTRTDAPVRVAFRQRNSVGTRDELAFAARCLACALPYRRFAATLAGADARLGADVGRYSFIVVDLHHLLLSRSPGALRIVPLSVTRAPSFRGPKHATTSLTQGDLAQAQRREPVAQGHPGRHLP